MSGEFKKVPSSIRGDSDYFILYKIKHFGFSFTEISDICSKIFILIFIFLVTITTPGIRAQNIDRWPDEIIFRTNTARDFNLLDPEERQLIFLTNLARTDGELFTETILLPYLKEEKPTRYTRSLIRDLKKIKNLDLLFPEEDLFRVAEEHSETSGKKGSTGHQGFNRRYGPLLGKYNEVAENCAYGYDKAMDILIRLLIDEDIPELGHRKNLLNPNFNAIGISISPHKKYRYNCVMSFGKKVN